MPLLPIGALLLLCAAQQHATATAISISLHHFKLPVFFVPPLTGVELEVKRLQTPSTPHFSWCPPLTDWTTLWISPAVLIPQIFSCFVENMRVFYDAATSRSRFADGITVRPTHGFERTLNPLAPLMWGLERRGWLWGRQLQAHIYDWRLTPNDWASLPEYGWQDLKQSIEDLRAMNGGRKVVLVGVSMGSTYVSSFLSQFVSQEWKDVNVAGFFSSSGVFGGTPTAAQGIISGRLEGLELLFNKEGLQAVMRHLPALAWLAPHPEVYGDQVIVENTALGQTFTASDLDRALQGSGATDAAAAWEQVFSYPSHIAPNVTTYCLLSNGLKTLTKLTFNTKDYADEPVITYTDGDGTVPLAGLQAACDTWAKLPGPPTFSRVIPNVGHGSILNARGAVQYVVQEILALGMKEAAEEERRAMGE